jgi:cytochrome b pre-mRNA-processing protein 3
MTEDNRDRAETSAMSPGWRRLMSFFRQAPEPSPAHRLYSELVNHARYPFYYATLAVPDTPEGRFEILALHVGLVIRRLMQEGALGRDTAQALMDLMVTDLDVNLRELGVGDLAVGKQVKRMAGQFNARLEVLKRAFDTGDHELLRPMLATNAYHGIASPAADHVTRLILACAALEMSLAGQAVTRLRAGGIDLPDERTLSDVSVPA